MNFFLSFCDFFTMVVSHINAIATKDLIIRVLANFVIEESAEMDYHVIIKEDFFGNIKLQHITLRAQVK